MTAIFFLCSSAGMLLAQQGGRSSVIRGTVKDTDGNPVAYANVYLKNTSLGTQSDLDGKFFLRVIPGKHTLCVQ
ncbi:MAG: carboxypeptidase-like regulatory domain-containing protein, partial [Tannerella sp.]|nr:carboxypeptidase-like regulatory domain-containing protein [Tannerella sp.]